MTYKVNDVSDLLEDAGNDEGSWHIMTYVYDADVNYVSDKYYYEVWNSITGAWRATHWEGPRVHGYKDVLTAFDVVQSAFWRHNYNWAYWVKLMVVKGEYNSNDTPVEDTEYLKGKEPIKMMNFKEFVIRNDEKTLKMFENEETNNTPVTNSDDPASIQRVKFNRSSYLNKRHFRPFYYGFLLKSSVTPQDDKQIDGYPGYLKFRNEMRTGWPRTPNYVACFIPNKEEDKVTQGIIPELAVKTTRRYTRVQGYSESKRFYSPDYTNNKPDEKTKDYRRTLLWESNATVGDDGCITVELHNNSKETILLLDVAGMKDGKFYTIE